MCLVELDATLAGRASSTAAAHSLGRVEVRVGDAGNTDQYGDAVPADLLLVCGVFGNIATDDIARTVQYLPMLCAPGATVIWTRHRREPDLTPVLRRWFSEVGMTEVAFEAPGGDSWVGVGVHRLDGAPRQFEPSVQLFTFVT